MDQFGYENICFIKIDVEGMEIEVLKGAYETIQKSKPYIMVESFGEKIETVNGILSNIGYSYIELPGENYLFVQKGD